MGYLTWIGIILTGMLFENSAIAQTSVPLEPASGVIQFENGELCTDNLSGKCLTVKRNTRYDMLWNGDNFQGLCVDFGKFSMLAKNNKSCKGSLKLPTGGKICKRLIFKCLLYTAPTSTLRSSDCQCQGTVDVQKINKWPNLSLLLYFRNPKKIEKFSLKYQSIRSSLNVSLNSSTPSERQRTTQPTTGFSTSTADQEVTRHPTTFSIRQTIATLRTTFPQRETTNTATLSFTSSNISTGSNNGTSSASSGTSLLAACLASVFVLLLALALLIYIRINRQKKLRAKRSATITRDQNAQCNDVVAASAIQTTDVYEMATDDVVAGENTYETVQGHYGKVDNCLYDGSSSITRSQHDGSKDSLAYQSLDKTETTADGVYNNDAFVTENVLYEVTR